MPASYRIEPAEEIPDGASVCHYDELDESAKYRLPDVVGSGQTTTTDPAFESTAETCDLVKFTDFFRIERL